MTGASLVAAVSRRCRTLVTLQTEQAECGAACLRSLLGYHGKWVSLGELREACGVGRDGCSAADILRAARSFGLIAKGWRWPMRRIHLSPLPVILYWEFNHFVILEGVSKGRYFLNDPASGHRVVDEETFDKGFTGVVLQFEKGPDFQANAKPPGPLTRLWFWLRDFKPAVILVWLMGLILGMSTLAVPLLLSVLIDRVLIQGAETWGGPLIALMVVLGIVIYLLTWMQGRLLRRLAIAIAIAQSDRHVTHLFRLPLQYFTRRLTGDLLLRLQTIDVVARDGAARMLRMAIEAVMCAAFLGVMFVFDTWLACSMLALCSAYTALVRIVARLRNEYNTAFRREQGIHMGEAMAGLRFVYSLRATANENSFFSRWGGNQAKELGARQRFEELGHVMGALPGMFLILGSMLVLGIGGWKVISGAMTVGTLMGFFVLTGNLLRPLGEMARYFGELQVLDADLRRLDDIAEVEPAEPAAAPAMRYDGGTAMLDGRLRLTGRLEIRNVAFGFQRNRPPLIENFSLTIQPGERVALVGSTGSGKTSLLLLVAGVYRPWSGEILFDGHRLEDIPVEIFSESVAMVDQNPVLFDATVRENLTFWDPTVLDEFVLNAARDAAIHDAIVSRRGGYDAPVREGGTNFSGGQQQRLEIARALVRNPSLLILDEATSSVDALTEVEIDNALRRRGCTSLIVAHRLSTIRDCDLILVMEKGKVIQSGQHADLIAEAGPYGRLIDAA